MEQGDDADVEALTDCPTSNADLLEEESDLEDDLNQLLISHHEKTIASVLIRQADSPQPVCEELDVLKLDKWEEFRDDLTGKLLDPEMVKDARRTELKYIDECQVWDLVPRPKDVKVIGSRWVDINKGDEVKPNYRSRFVGRELKKLGQKSNMLVDFFAAMPPLEAIKFLLTLAVTKEHFDLKDKRVGNHRKRLQFLDVKRAHFMAPVHREMYVELPPELKREGEDLVAKLKQSLYGTRDAPANWEKEIARVLVEELQFEQGKSYPCIFHHPERDIDVVVHGDDFTDLAEEEQLIWFREELKKRWIIEDRGILAPPGSKPKDATTKYCHNMTHLNRLITWTHEGIEWESDPRHVDLLLRDIGVQSCKVTYPLVKEKVESLDQEDTELPVEEQYAYRSNTMRMGYLSHDRTDLQRTVRELAKGMQAPTLRHLEMLKRAARYLKYAPRAVQLFPWQRLIKDLDSYCDTDHAGCVRTRKSTSGGVLMLGKCMNKSYCRGQSVIALSSGEAEYYGLVSVISESLGFKSMAADFNVKVSIVVHMDATAGAAIGSRRGLGKVKHVDTAFLWVQEHVQKGTVVIKKVHTSLNLADILTKAIDGQLLRRMMLQMGFVFPVGRHTLGLGVVK